MSDDSIVVLSHPTALATKRFWLGDDGKTKTEPYGEGKYFRAETVPLASLEDLAGLLDLLSNDPRTYCVRGEIIPGVNLDRIRRAKKPSEADPSFGFREYPRRWLMVDVDGLDPSLHADWHTKEGCAAAANLLLGKLPLELRMAGHVWQCSASAGIKPGLRMHFWFWLDRPLGETELERWGEFVNDTAGKRVLDLAVFRTVQPLYTASPIFDNVLDPVAQRMGYVPGAAAVLPRTSARNDIWKRKLEPLYFTTNDKIHDHVRDACASYFCAHGSEAPKELLRNAVIEAVARAKELQSRPEDYPEGKIDEEIESGRQFAATRAASGENLLIDNQGQPRGNIANMLAVMQSHADWQRMLAWNTRAHRIEIIRETPWGAKPGEWVDARDSVQATGWFAREKRMGVDDGTLLRAATTFARENEVDPVVDELNTFEWDGKRRIDGVFIHWCGAQDTSYTRQVSRMFFIGCVARALLPGCKNDTMLALQGPTGMGKSTLIETLAGCTANYAAVMDEKDILQKIHGPWLTELPELGPFRKMHYNSIKGFLSTRIDRFRAPYMRLPEDRPRTSVCVATLNPEGVGWQEDPTSARRFWPLDVTDIDIESIAAARSQIWAEAVAAFRAGEHWWVDDPEDPRFRKEQEKIYAADTWESVFTRVLRDGGNAFAPGGRQVVIDKGATEFQLGDLMSVCFQDHKADKREQMRASRALMRIGYTNEGTVWRKVLPPTEDLG